MFPHPTPTLFAIISHTKWHSKYEFQAMRFISSFYFAAAAADDVDDNVSEK